MPSGKGGSRIAPPAVHDTESYGGPFARVAFLVFIVALGVRLLHVWAMRDSPFFSVLMGDARGYDTWARQIAAGDWIGRDVFYQAPLYPYFIGVIYALFGVDLMALRVVQAIVGSLSCALVGYAGARLFSPPVGIVAGLALALYGPAIFFDFIIQKSVLDVFFVCAALAVLGRLASGRRVNPGGSKDPPLQKKGSPTRASTEIGTRVTDIGTRVSTDTGTQVSAATGRGGSSRPPTSALAGGGGSSDPPWEMSAPAGRGGSSDPPWGMSAPDGRGGSLDPPRWMWVVLGIAIGCLALTRENALLLVPLIGAWIWLERRRTAWRLAAVPLTLFMLGLAITLAPVAVRNYAVGGGLYLTTSQFGSNFYIGNNPDADGTYTSLRFGRGSPEYERIDATELAERAVGRRLTPGEVSSYWTSRALEFITSQPGDWLRLQLRKVALLVNAVEMVDTESQEAHAEYSWLLRVLLPIGHFGVLMPLAVFGLLVSRRDARLWLLYAIGLTYAVSTVMFFVFARYRYPLVPLLILFAAAGVVWLAGFARDARRGRRPSLGGPADRAALIALPLAMIIVTNWPMLSVDRMRAITETNLGTALQEAGRPSEAVERYHKALAVQSDYAPAYNNLGVALRAQGRVADAIAAYEQGLRLRDAYPDLHFNLANALMADGRPGEAAEHLRKAAAVTPDSASVHNNLGKALAEKGQVADAVREFERALQLEPDSVQAHRNLGAVLPALGRHDEALAHLQRAVAIAPTDAEAQYDLGRLWLESERFTEAATAFGAAVTAKPDYVEARNNLGIALASQGDLRNAIAQWEEALRIKPDFADARRNLELARKGR